MLVVPYLKKQSAEKEKHMRKEEIIKISIKMPNWKKTELNKKLFGLSDSSVTNILISISSYISHYLFQGFHTVT